MMLGVDWDLDRRWSVGVAYRLLRMGEVSTGRFATNDRINAQNYDSLQVMLGLTYTF